MCRDIRIMSAVAENTGIQPAGIKLSQQKRPGCCFAALAFTALERALHD
jgi:hypothetical protein